MHIINMDRNRIFAIALLCVLLSGSSLLTNSAPTRPNYAEESYREWLENARSHQGYRYPIAGYDQIIEQNRGIDDYYAHAYTYTMVVDFFVRVTGSEQIALPIIYHAEQNNIPLALMFSVSWVESKYKPYAYNHNPTTIDRGLFQLNSASFRNLHLEEFFNPEINSLHAAKYLRYCLDKGANNMETALAIYNAGLGRVRRGTIPASTMVYISRVLEYRTQLIGRFETYIQERIATIQNSQQL